MKKHNKQDQDNTQPGRRRFLTGVAAAAPAVAAVAVAPRVTTAAEAAAPQFTEAKGYRLTPHILAYYKTAAR